MNGRLTIRVRGQCWPLNPGSCGSGYAATTVSKLGWVAAEPLLQGMSRSEVENHSGIRRKILLLVLVLLSLLFLPPRPNVEPLPPLLLLLLPQALRCMPVREVRWESCTAGSVGVPSAFATSGAGVGNGIRGTILNASPR